jgi:hypothetical protein
MTLKGQEGKYAEKAGAGGMVEASADDAVVEEGGVEEGGVEEGGVEEGVVGGVKRVEGGRLMALLQLSAQLKFPFVLAKAV